MWYPFNVIINLNNLTGKKVINSQLHLWHSKSLNYGITKCQRMNGLGVSWDQLLFFHRWGNKQINCSYMDAQPSKALLKLEFSPSFYFISFWLCRLFIATYRQQGIEPMSPALESRFLTTGLPGKSHCLTQNTTFIMTLFYSKTFSDFLLPFLKSKV